MVIVALEQSRSLLVKVEATQEYLSVVLVLEWQGWWDLDEVDVMSLSSAIIQFNQVGKLV